MSRGFYLPYRVLTGVTLHDPSCPLVLTRREVAASLLPRLGEMTEGFWWEFNARVRAMGLSQLELPINHRERTAGATQVYRPGSLARIAVRHLLALPRIRAGSRTRRAAG